MIYSSNDFFNTFNKTPQVSGVFVSYDVVIFSDLSLHPFCLLMLTNHGSIFIANNVLFVQISLYAND